MNYYFLVLKKYAVTEGRASRSEFWYFVLFNIIVVLGLSLIEGILGIASDTEESVLAIIYQLIVFIPSIALGIRRMQDVNKPGWFLLIPFYNLILTITDWTKGDNKYGPDPKATEFK